MPLPNIKSTFNRSLHFSPASCPIAPLLTESSSYALYQDFTTKNLKVIKISSTGSISGNEIDIGEVGEPFDITSTPDGFVILARLNDKAWVAAYKSDGSNKWKVIL